MFRTKVSKGDRIYIGDIEIIIDLTGIRPTLGIRAPSGTVIKKVSAEDKKNEQ